MTRAPPPAGCGQAEAIADCFGGRLWWSEDRHADLRNVAVVSSRVARPQRRLAPWLLALRWACRDLEAGAERLLTSPGTTTHRWIERSGRLWQLPCLWILAPRRRESPEAWLARRIESLGRSPPVRPDRWYVSPPCDPLAGSRDEPVWADLAAPLRDRLVVTCAARVCVLGLRRGGNLWPLLQARLGDRRWDPASLEFVEGTGFIDRALEAELRARGARPRRLRTRSLEREATAVNPAPPNCNSTNFTSTSCPALRAGRWRATPADDRWLTHCTRAPRGPWPDQTEAAYLDDWLRHPLSADYSAQAALRRILEQGRIRAGRQGIRGGAAVVSFTAVPPAQLARLHVYRRHRRRWDFEPFGLAIRREWLIERGAQPVHYGDDSLWRQLEPDERPYFQRRQSGGNGETAAIDWSAESEWRHLGDLPLADLPPDQALILVPSLAAARQLAAHSRWPLAIIPA